VVRGPEVREQHQTERPSETGLELFAGPDYAIFDLFFSEGARHMNSGNFQKSRINLHTLELAFRSKRKRERGGGGRHGSIQNLCVSGIEIFFVHSAVYHFYFHNDMERERKREREEISRGIQAAVEYH